MPEIIYKLKAVPTLRAEGNLRKRHIFRIKEFGKIEAEKRLGKRREGKKKN